MHASRWPQRVLQVQTGSNAPCMRITASKEWLHVVVFTVILQHGSRPVCREFAPGAVKAPQLLRTVSLRRPRPPAGPGLEEARGRRGCVGRGKYRLRGCFLSRQLSLLGFDRTTRVCSTGGGHVHVPGAGERGCEGEGRDRTGSRNRSGGNRGRSHG